jgi:hypothetical protein
MVFASAEKTELNVQASVKEGKTLKGRSKFEVRTYIRSDEFDHTIREVHDFGAFQLAVAKMGYCFAAVELGLERVANSPLHMLVTGHRKDTANLVGSLSVPIVEATDEMHIIRMEGRRAVIVHLFADHGTDFAYEVFIG